MTIAGLDCVSNGPDDFVMVSLLSPKKETSTVAFVRFCVCVFSYRSKREAQPTKKENRQEKEKNE